MGISNFKKLPLLIAVTMAALILLPNSAKTQCSSNVKILGYEINGTGSAAFGYMISGIGDLDDDGLPDILVARTSGSFGSPAGVFAFSGLTGDSIRTILEVNPVYTMSAYGDFNDDGQEDVLINGSIRSGADGSSFRDYRSVAVYGVPIDDVNGDGYNDIIVGNSQWDNGILYNVGRVDILSGWTGDTLMSWVGQGTQIGNYGFGSMAVPAGDFNNDGVADILVGEPGNDAGGIDRGHVYVFSGTNIEDTLFSRSGVNQQGSFGIRLVGVGDVNNDGWDDFAALEGITNSTPVLRVFSGRFGNLLYSIPTPEYAGAWASAIAGAGDINGDGYDDIVVGDYFRGTNRGRVHLYSGINGSELYNTGTGTFGRIKLGYSVAGVGDVDGDGHPDFAAGAPWEPDPNDRNNMIGAAYVFHCVYPDAECQADEDTDGDGLGDMCDNCPWAANRNQEDADRDGLGDKCEGSRDAYVGSNQSVSLNAAGDIVYVIFDSVSQGGVVELSISDQGPAAGSNFAMVPSDPPKYFEISTEALFEGEIEIKLPYDDTGMSLEDENSLSIWHYYDALWSNITTERDTVHNQIIGRTTSLSPYFFKRHDIGPPVDLVGSSGLEESRKS